MFDICNVHKKFYDIRRQAFLYPMDVIYFLAYLNKTALFKNLAQDIIFKI